MVQTFPAPWHLTGRGYILLYRFRPDFIRRSGGLPARLPGTFAGGWSSLMLVDYTSSEAGPYAELLFIPGRFALNRRKYYSISRIYVSTPESVINGRRNWGIPKEEAEIRFQSSGPGLDRVTVQAGGEVILEADLKARGPAVPINTRWLPFSFELVQDYAGRRFFTRLWGRGRAQPAVIRSLRINPSLFPDISPQSPLLAFKIDPFKLVFPVPRVEALPQTAVGQI